MYMQFGIWFEFGATQMTKYYNPDTVYKHESALLCVLSSLTQFYDGVNSGLTSSQLIL